MRALQLHGVSSFVIVTTAVSSCVSTVIRGVVVTNSSAVMSWSLILMAGIEPSVKSPGWTLPARKPYHVVPSSYVRKPSRTGPLVVVRSGCAPDSHVMLLSYVRLSNSEPFKSTQTGTAYFDAGLTRSAGVPTMTMFWLGEFGLYVW